MTSITVFDIISGNIKTPLSEITEFNASNCNIDDLKILNLSRFKKLRSLNISKNRISNLEEIKFCPTIEYLDCSNCLLNNIDGINYCPNLEILKMEENKTLFDEIKFDIIFNNLKEIQCNKCQIYSFKNLKNCPKLEILFCKSNRLRPSLLEEINNCPNLVEIDCSNNGITKYHNYLEYYNKYIKNFHKLKFECSDS